MKKDELDYLCGKIGRCSRGICQKDEFSCARKVINEYVGNDKNLALKIKAQIKRYDNDNFNVMNYMISFVSIAGFILAIFSKIDSEGIIYKEFSFWAMLVLFILSFLNIVNHKSEKKKSIKVRYIEVLIDDVLRKL